MAKKYDIRIIRKTNSEATPPSLRRRCLYSGLASEEKLDRAAGVLNIDIKWYEFTM